MCGRYTLTDLTKFTDPRQYQLPIVPFGFKPRFNIAPGQDAPVVVNASPTQVTMARWGLIPSWAKDAAIGYRMINARAETVTEKPAFRRLIKQQRCLIIADGFYEWQQVGKQKVPHRLLLKTGEPFSFAGLWDAWVDPGTKTRLVTYTIITTAANALVKPIHDRMPVILTRAGEAEWLNDQRHDREALALLAAYPAAQMKAEEVSPLVNSPRHDGPEVLRAPGRPVLHQAT